MASDKTHLKSTSVMAKNFANQVIQLVSVEFLNHGGY